MIRKVGTAAANGEKQVSGSERNYQRPYGFGVFGTQTRKSSYYEKDLEQSINTHTLTEALLEMGNGFSFMPDKTYLTRKMMSFVDLVFYNRLL